jgi:hypothetical protein
MGCIRLARIARSPWLAAWHRRLSRPVTQYNKSYNMCRLQFVDSHLVDGNMQFHTFLDIDADTSIFE